MARQKVEQEFEPSNSVLICLALIVVLLSSLIVFGMHKQTLVGSSKTPEVIFSLLDSVVGIEDYQSNLDELLSDYIFIDEKAINEEGYNKDFLNFEKVFHLYDTDAMSYQITYQTDMYSEVTLLDSTGDPIYPRIGFKYLLNEDGNKIVGYTLCRLQPFSTRHVEYHDEWNRK